METEIIDASLESLQQNPDYLERLTDSEVTFEELVSRLYKYPVASINYIAIRQEIQKRLTDEKYNEFLIAFPSMMHGNYSSHPQKKQLDALNYIRGIVRADNYESGLKGIDELFSSTYSFPETQEFLFKRRRLLEYNPEYKQLVVSAYITDGNYVILLQTGTNGETRIQGKFTFIQGHVDLDPMIYIKSQKDFLLDNLKREFREEIQMTDEVYASQVQAIIPKFYVNDNSNHIGLEHFGIIYEIQVKSCSVLFNNITSGEESKHEIMMFDKWELKNGPLTDSLDSWVKMVFDKLQ
jgi:predicted NUDIX family phosphoesterase